MTLSIAISPEVEAKLKAQAAVAGVDIETFAAQSLARLVLPPPLEALLAPLRQQVADSGLTESDLTDLLEQAKHEARAEQRMRTLA